MDRAEKFGGEEPRRIESKVEPGGGEGERGQRFSHIRQ